MPRLLLALALTLTFACAGPEAPDAAVCQDVLHRLCLAQTCEGLEERLAAGVDCAQTLRARTGCGDETFSFSQPSRDAVLECRRILVRSSGTGAESAPECEDVQATFDACPDLVGFVEAP